MRRSIRTRGSTSALCQIGSAAIWTVERTNGQNGVNIIHIPELRARSRGGGRKGVEAVLGTPISFT
jgi:hypothetical protein